ncbi:ABC transporter ATP-binding protein [Rhodobacteraceae bacterium NNCM2]|nr:ABC transporter ATP-binding protein [Coraliihabitans acroporae]
MADPVLGIRGLSKSFGALAATDDVSLDLMPGEVHALIGPNGAGKTTLIGQIAGGIRPDAGQVFLGGEDVTALSIARRAQRGLGRTFQISSLAMALSALGNVMISAQSVEGSSFRFWRPVRRDEGLRAAAMEALGQVGLAARAEVPVAELSHGERRQVEVACALALRPRALLLDEPMAGLGAEGSAELTRFLGDLKSRVPILLVEHDMDAVFQLADRISVLVYGRIIASGTVAEIRSDPAVREAYLGDAA